MIRALQHYWQSFQDERQRHEPVLSPGTDPVFLGPWLGEVGPELQYWIPWLQKLKQAGCFQGRRVIAVSRGGVAAWYHHLTEEYIEIFDYYDNAGYQALRAEKSTEKQFQWTHGETAFIQKLAQQLNIQQYNTIHPGAMWLRILPYFKERQDTSWILDQLLFLPIAGTLATVPDLPQHYIALRFYQSELFPATPENQMFVQELLTWLTRDHEVVALISKQQVDDHSQFPIPNLARVHPVILDQSLATNLALQTAVLAGADSFFGTYGGLTVLPGLLGKPGFGFIGASLGSQRTLHFRHEAITQSLYQTFAQPYLIQTVASWRYAQAL